MVEELSVYCNVGGAGTGTLERWRRGKVWIREKKRWEEGMTGYNI